MMEQTISLLQKFVNDHTKRKQRLGLGMETDFICMCELCIEARKLIQDSRRVIKPSGQIGQ